MTVEIAIQNAILKNVDDRTLQISLHFGILPHFIIGVAVKKDFFVNPAIFATMDQMAANDSYRTLCSFRRNVLQNGLSVDQTNFMDFCRQTNYRRYYTVDHRQYSVHILNPD